MCLSSCGTERIASWRLARSTSPCVEIRLPVNSGQKCASYSFIGRDFGDPASKDRSHQCTTEGDRLNQISVSLLAEAATRLHFVFEFLLQVKDFFYR